MRAGAMESADGTRYGPLTGLAWLHFVNDGAANFLPGVLPVILVGMGKSAALAGTLMFVLLAGQALQPLTGLFGAKLGGRKLMFAGVIGTALGAGLIGFASHFGILLVLLGLMGIANACFHPQALASARSFSGKRSGFGLAMMMLGGEIGRGIWPLVASIVVVYGSLESLWIPALVGLVSIPLLAPWLAEPPRSSTAWRVPMKGRKGGTGKLLAYAGLRGLVATGAVTYLPILWKARHGGLIGGATLVTLMLMVGIIGNLYGGHLADRIGRGPVLVASSLAMAVCVALIAWGTGPLPWIGAALLGIPTFATFPVTTLVGQDLFPENRSFGSGLALGLGNALGAGLVALLGLTVGWISVPTLFWILAAVALVTAPLAGMLPKASELAPS